MINDYKYIVYTTNANIFLGFNYYGLKRDPYLKVQKTLIINYKEAYIKPLYMNICMYIEAFHRSVIQATSLGGYLGSGFRFPVKHSILVFGGFSQLASIPTEVKTPIISS